MPAWLADQIFHFQITRPWNKNRKITLNRTRKTKRARTKIKGLRNKASRRASTPALRKEDRVPQPRMALNPLTAATPLLIPVTSKASPGGRIVDSILANRKPGSLGGRFRPELPTQAFFRLFSPFACFVRAAFSRPGPDVNLYISNRQYCFFSHFSGYLQIEPPARLLSRIFLDRKGRLTNRW
jgi:hypothetical protein